MAEAQMISRPAELPEWVQRLRHGGPIPLSTNNIFDMSSDHRGQAQAAAAATAGGCSWACPPGKLFYVRGADYEDSKTKIVGGKCLLQPLAIDFLQGPCKVARIMERPDCRVRAALEGAVAAAAAAGEKRPFVWVFNYQLCTSANHSLVLYFVSFDAPSQGSLLQRFLDGDDAFRKSRLKALVRLPEAPWVVQALVGARWPACIVGNLLKCSYTRHDNYLQVDVDMGSSPLVRTAVHFSFGLARLVVVDLAFVLEGIYSHELPENILAAVRLHKLDPSSASYIDDFMTTTVSAAPPSLCATDAPRSPLRGGVRAPGLIRGGLLRLLGKKGKAF